MEKPPALGDERSPRYHLVRGELPLPTSRKEIVQAFTSVLNRGGVQKVVVEMNEPIRFEQLVLADPNAGPPPVEAPGSDMLEAARNVEMFDLSVDLPSFRALYEAFALISNRQLKAKALYVSDLSKLYRWLGVPETLPLEEVYGVSVFKSEEIPDDACLLMASSPTNIDKADVEFSVRIPMTVFPKRLRQGESK